MLKSISCEKLIKTPLSFKPGLNAVVGADDAHNSIGKSSLLMLIDFAFGGGDFPSKCDDVIKHIGHFKIGITFEFEIEYSFIRDTENPDKIYRISEQDFISLKEFNEFLKEKYLPKVNEISFRECVSGFFRIYQRNNYNDKRPLDIIQKDKWNTIRKRTLKIFGKYWTIAQLEQEISIKQKYSKDIKGTFSSGAVKQITKAQFNQNKIQLDNVSREVDSIRKALEKNVTDIKSIINDRNLTLKKEKDNLVDIKFDLELQLSRIESNLSYSKIRNSKSFQTVVNYFPDIDSEKLAQVESFHKGITRLLKNQLLEEKEIIVKNIDIAETDISRINKELLELVDSKEDSVYLLERLMELDRLRRELLQQNEYWGRNTEVKDNIESLKYRIDNALEDSINEIEEILNAGMKFYIESIYRNKPILPKIIFGKSDYKFEHGDDRGTGKGFANMIALDLTFLEKTDLPCLVHDSLLFKNMAVPAVEHLISIYESFEKQVFISIDEVPKFSREVQLLIKKAMFLKLDQDRLAFIVKWKKRNE